ncbi:MAG: ribonuclease R [Gammaproteobacteria bacterium]|nr:ribonuclease R [Gammaproteobacteria bacterium]
MKQWQEDDPQYESEKKKYPHPVPSRSYILDTIKESGKSLSFATLAKLFELNRGEKETLHHRIKAMLRDDQLEERGNGKLRIAKPRPAIIGRVFAHPEGYGFFIPDDKTLTDGHDLFLSFHAMQNVMHGDIAEAKVLKSSRRGKKEGKVVRVIEHANKKVLGRLVDDFGIKVVKAENRRIHQKILVTNVGHLDVKDNSVVEVTITGYPEKNQPIIGEITKVLGDKMDAGMEIDMAISNHHLPHEWPEEVIKQTVAIPDELSEEDYENRVDIRHLPLVTIDGITAKDFDDAVFAKKTSTGYLLYVAIADVAHYVKKDSPLDTEAVNRATSVYFPNRVIPMLPEKLSNGLCSLNPHVDRLCMVCEMLIGNDGQIKRSKFYEAVMHSHARLTYETVEEVLFNETATLPKEQAKVLPHLEALKSLYLILREQRNERGAIDFHTVEPEFEYDAVGKIDRIVAKTGLRSHQLIEECMVRANVCAAKFLLKQKGKDKPIALFRNHESPTEEKIEKLVTAMAQEGIKIPQIETIEPKHFANIIERIKDHEHFEALQMLVLRSMHQAVYQPSNEGHFGLALEHYAHFTSPIRRYPDLLVHRAIKHGVKYKNELYVYSAEQMEALGEQCSMAERRADDAVYDVIGHLKCEYLADKLGQQYAATISTVTSFGLFATLDGQFVDGLIHIKSLGADFFNFDEKRQVLIGERSHKVFKVGDSVDIIVSNVSVDDRRVDFILTDEHLPFAGKSASKSSEKPNNKTSRKSRKKKPTKKGKK